MFLEREGRACLWALIPLQWIATCFSGFELFVSWLDIEWKHTVKMFTHFVKMFFTHTIP
jgi:hypothetical protein